MTTSKELTSGNQEYINKKQIIRIIKLMRVRFSPILVYFDERMTDSTLHIILSVQRNPKKRVRNSE